MLSRVRFGYGSFLYSLLHILLLTRLLEKGRVSTFLAVPNLSAHKLIGPRKHKPRLTRQPTKQATMADTKRSSSSSIIPSIISFISLLFQIAILVVLVLFLKEFKDLQKYDGGSIRVRPASQFAVQKVEVINTRSSAIPVALPDS